MSENANQTPAAAEPAVMLTEAEVTEYRELKPKYDETVRALTEAKATIQSQSSRIEALETAQRAQRFTSLVKGAEGGARWFGDVDEHVAMLNDLAQQFGEDSEQIRRYIATNTGYATSVMEAGLFTAAGKSVDGETSTSALDRINEKAKEYAEATGVSHAQAFTHVIETDRELAAAYARERN